MTDEKVREVIGIYRRFFEKHNIPKKEFMHDAPVPVFYTGTSYNSYDLACHCHAILDKMEKFLEEGRIKETMRWLGFIQGCLWATGCYALDELENHNRP